MSTSISPGPGSSAYVNTPSLPTGSIPSSTSTPPLTSQFTSNTSTNTTSFQFPRTHSFPPFYTLQPNASTLHAQLTKWSSIILAYCAFHRITKLALSSALESDLFYNKTINRRLGRKELDEIMAYMRKDGTVENVAKGKEEGGVVWVWWRSVEEWGQLIENWVEETGQKNTVLTLYELTESDATIGQDFHGLNPDILQRALGVLVKRGKAQIFGQEDSQGVKFF